MTINVFTNEEVGGAKVLIPDGTIVQAKIKTDGKINDRGEAASVEWNLEVYGGDYDGAEIKDFIGLKGKDYYVKRGQNAMMYALDLNRNAHTKLPDTSGYQIESYAEFNGMLVLMKVKITTGQIKKDNGEIHYFHKNEVDSYATPRADSSTHKIYEAWSNGQQPWMSDKKPTLPQNTMTPQGDQFWNNQPPAGHPAAL